MAKKEPRLEELSEEETVEEPTVLEAEEVEKTAEEANSETTELDTGTCTCETESNQIEEEDLAGHEDEMPEEEEPVDEEAESEPEEEPEEEEMADDLLGALREKLKPAFDEVLGLVDSEDAKGAMDSWWGMLEKWLGEYPVPEKQAEDGYPPPEEEEEKGESEPSLEPESEGEKEFPKIMSQSDDFDVEEVQALLTSSAKRLDEKDAVIAQLKANVAALETYRKQVEEIREARHADLVGRVVKREMSLGLLSTDSVDSQKAMYEKLTCDDLLARLNALANAKPMEVKRQSLKSDEVSPAEQAVTEQDAKMAEIFKKTGLDFDAWKKYKEGK